MGQAVQLSILIATLGRREKKFKRLLKTLLPQTEGKPVEVIAHWNNGECSIGDIRHLLLEKARGEYVCFVDDDDMVPDYYVEEILKHLGKDYVGFRVELINDGTKKPPVTHSLVYPEWYEDYDGYYRNVTHLNPIKRKIALMGDYTGKDFGEDVSWAMSVLPFTKTENFIDRVMYFYLHESMDTEFGSNETNPKNKQFNRPNIKHRNFRYARDLPTNV